MKKNIILIITVIISVNLIGIICGLLIPVEPIRDYISQIETKHSRDSHTEISYRESADSKLKSVLRDIAGTYELVENKGIYGFTTVYVVSINQDGTGRMVNSDGSVETFSSARLSGSNKIVFSGNYGGTVFLLSGVGIEDESAKRYVTEAGTPKYIMRKR